MDTNVTYISVGQAKNMIRNHNLTIKDTSGIRSYGYEFSIFRTEQVDTPPFTRATGEPLLASVTVYEPETVNKLGNRGAIRQVFDSSAIEALLERLHVVQS